MMEFTEDHIALAAEYALGTLSADERAQVELTMAANPDFAAMVEGWERRLAALHQMVGPIEPPPEVWERIRAAVRRLATPASAAPVIAIVPDAANEVSHLTTAHAKTGDATAPVSPPESGRTELSPESKRVVHFAVRARLWSWAAMGTGAIAASLLLIIAAQLYQPDLLPNALRPAIRTQIVRVSPPPPPMPAQYVALLQPSPNSPAFILTVDSGSKTFSVRKVGAADEPDKSYELWIVSDKLQRPRSLGVIGGDDFTVRAALSAFDAETMHQATYAVTMEPKGGSPTGVATGPVVYTGKLIETVPEGAVRK